MTVNNGSTHVLAIGGVHLGYAGSQTGPNGKLIVAFKPNLGRMTDTAGGDVRLDDKPYRITKVSRSEVTAGFYRIELVELAA